MKLWVGTLFSVLALTAVGGTRAPAPTGPAELEGAYPVEIKAKGLVREFTIRAAPTHLPLFGRPSVDVWAYNGQVPGPTLRIKLGETLRVRFHNDLPQPTTIHWHGVRVPNAMDGVPGVTQPPIPPGGDFVYEFTPKDAGTFWFHPHVRSSEQVERGLFGILVVEDAEPPPFSRELVLVLDDWLVGQDFQIDPQFNTGRDLAHDGRWGNVITVNGERVPQLKVQPGERLRLRLLNVANGRVFAPDFTGLDARVIAVDGLYAGRPVDPSSLEMAPGNRLDLDLTIPATAGPDAHWAINDVFAARNTRYALAEQRKIRPDLASSVAENAMLARIAPQPLFGLQVAGRKAEPLKPFPSPAQAHVPAWPDAAAQPLRAEFKLDARLDLAGRINWTINDQAFDHETHGSGTDLAVLPYGKWSKLRFVNKSFRLHPMHLHGTFFKLLTRNGVAVDEPFFRDTVLIRQQETVEIGLVPVDKGRWMMHCHILEHAESGMMALLRVE